MAAYTWVGNTTDYNTGSNWTGGPLPNVVPTLTDTITFSNNKPCDTGASNRTCAGVTFSGYSSVLTLTSNLICNGSLTMQSDQSIRTNGAGTFIIGGNCTITPNGGTWGTKLQIGNITAIAVTLLAGFSVNGTLTFTSSSNLIGGFSISAIGNVFATNGCIVTTSNTAATTLIFAGATSQWSGDGRLGCNITFQGLTSDFVVSGSVNFGVVPNVAYQNPTLAQTSSNSFTASSSTLGIIGTCTLSLQNITLGNVNFRTGGLSQTFTITLNESLNIGGNLATGVDGNGSHILNRTGSQTIQLQGNLTIGVVNATSTFSSSNTNGGKIVIIGKVASTSTLSGTYPSFGTNFCDIDIDIQAGANSVTFNTNYAVNGFNFGSTNILYPKRFKYISGNLIIANTTIGFAQVILDFPTIQPLNNVNLAAFSNAGTFQIVNDVTMTGNLAQGSTPFVGGAGYGTTTISPALGSTATSISIGGSLSITSTIYNGTFGTIKLRFVGNGSPQTLSGTSSCANNIDFVSGTYNIGNFIFGIGTGVVPTMKYLGGSVTAIGGTLTSLNAKYDIGAVQLNNLRTPTSNVTYTITITASPSLRVNGNFSANDGGNYNTTSINADPLTSSAQLDVYGNITIGNGATNYQPLVGNAKLYLKGTGTLTCGGILTSYLGIDTFFQGNTTIGNIVFSNSKKFEYISGSIISTPTSLTQINGTATIKSLGQTWSDIAINTASSLILDGNLTCRDLITYTGSSQYIGGSTYNLIVTRNMALGGTSGLTPLVANPVNKIIMSGAGTWSGTQQLGIDLDLNASGSTIIVQNLVSFYNSKTLRWYAGTTMSTTGSTLQVGSCTLNLGNQEWGNFISNLNSSVILTTNANFNAVTFGNGGGAAGSLSGNTPSLTFKVRSNFTNINASGSLQSAVGLNDVLLSMDGGGTFTSANATTNLSVQLTSGTTTLSGVVNWGGTGTPKSFTRTGGTLAGGTSTFIVGATSTISVPSANGSFWNVTMPPNATITLNAQMGIANNLVLSTTAANTITFASSGAFGWNTKNFTHGGGDTTCILNAGSTYNVSGTFQLLGSNDTTRATLRSSSLSSFTGTANGTTLTLASPESGSAIVPNMAISQATGVAPSTFATLLPTRPTIVSNISPLSWLITPAVTPSVGAIAMQSGLKAFFNLAPSTGVALVLFATTKDLDSNGGQTIYAFQSYTDAPSNPQANLFRTLNWNTLAPPVSPIGIGFISVT